MDGHAYIYVSDDAGSDTGLASRRRLAEWEGVPLTFKVLVSQNPHLVEAGTPGRVAIEGDFEAGRARLFEFLDELAGKQLFDEKQLAARVSALVTLLYGILPAPRHVTLEADALSDEAAGQQLLDEVSDVDGLIARSLTQLSDMKAAGRMDEMWHMLGVKARASGAAGSAPVSAPASGYQVVNSYTRPTTKQAKPVPLPSSFTGVCVANIVMAAIFLLFWTRVSIESDGGFQEGLPVAPFARFEVVYYTALIVVVAFVLKGSRTARLLYVIISVIGLPVMIMFLVSPLFILSILSLAVIITTLVVLYGKTGQAYYG